MKHRVRRLIAAVLCAVLFVTGIPFTAGAASVRPGDVDGNALLSLSDAMSIFYHVNEKTALSGTALTAADYNADGEVTLSDAMTVFYIVNEKIVEDNTPAHPTIRAGVTDEQKYMENLVVYNAGTGKSFSGDTKEGLQMAVAEIVKCEVGMSTFGENNSEAWKVFAVAAYTVLARACYSGSSYDIWMASDINLNNATDKRIYDAVGEVLGIKIAYNDTSKSEFNQLCQVFYGASSAGVTCNTLNVWGFRDFEYLEPVESRYDTDEWINHYSAGTDSLTHSFTIPMDELLDCVATYMEEDVIYTDTKAGEYSLYATKTDGPYWAYTNLWYYNSENVKTYVSGHNLYNAINVYHPTIHCYSHAITVTGESNGAVTIVTKGNGHGVGLSQYGVAGYANDAGWTYDQILAHYFSITEDSAWGLVGPKW